jgi:hypothetical protein
MRRRRSNLLYAATVLALMPAVAFSFTAASAAPAHPRARAAPVAALAVTTTQQAAPLALTPPGLMPAAPAVVAAPLADSEVLHAARTDGLVARWGHARARIAKARARARARAHARARARAHARARARAWERSRADAIEDATETRHATRARYNRYNRYYIRAAAYGSWQSITAALAGSSASCLNGIIMRESGGNVHAMNPSGAYGIPQALPGDKMASAGADWQSNPVTQVRWMIGYVNSTYGGACAALAHENTVGTY